MGGQGTEGAPPIFLLFLSLWERLVLVGTKGRSSRNGRGSVRAPAAGHEPGHGPHVGTEPLPRRVAPASKDSPAGGVLGHPLGVQLGVPMRLQSSLDPRE